MFNDFDNALTHAAYTESLLNLDAGLHRTAELGSHKTEIYHRNVNYESSSGKVADIVDDCIESEFGNPRSTVNRAFVSARL